MNRQQFIDYIKTPDKLNAESSGTLQMLAKEYPYCQTVDILYALNLYKENNIKYTDQLKIAAAYATDRKVLKQLLNSLTVDNNLTLQQDKKELVDHPIPKEKLHINIEQKEENLLELINHLKEEVTTFLIQSKYHDPGTRSISSFSMLADELEDILIKSGDTTLEDDKPIQQSLSAEYSLDHIEEIDKERKNQTTNLELIDRFIENEPKITPVPKSGFFDPVDHAKQSLIDNEDVVSETLAEIYYQQGNLSKAIKIYKKLCLVNPEKSTYFAAQIEKIQKEIK